MSELSSIDKMKFEKLFEMGNGYVLNFSNKTFQEFILDNVNIDIYNERYDYASGSKANRLRAFWTKESNFIVGKLLDRLLEYWKLQKQLNSQETTQVEKELFSDCKEIANTLIQKQIPTLNLTRTQGLAQEIKEKSWYTNPAGKHGYEIILLERIGVGGSRYYHRLKAGETLQLSERLFSNFIALQIDMRQRVLHIAHSFRTKDFRAILIEMNVIYRAIDARIIALETDDPLQEMYGRIVARLNKELEKQNEINITSELVEGIAKTTELGPWIGLSIERVNVLSVKQTIDIGNLNMLMMESPDVIPRVLKAFSQTEQKVINEKVENIEEKILLYIEQQTLLGDKVEPEEITNIFRGVLDVSNVQRGPQVFISYSRDDQKIADEIYAFLDSHNCSPWMDTHDLVPGQDWELEITQRIKISDFFVACLSNNSVSKRGYVQKELKYALSVLEQFPEGEIYLIPIRISDCNVPESLVKRQWLDWSAPNAKEQLLKAIKTK